MARKFLFILLASIIIGCAAAPSATPTNVATNTAPAPTNTFAPTKTSVATSTQIILPTETFQRRSIFTETPFPTLTITPTKTNTPLPTATSTPLPLSNNGPYFVFADRLPNVKVTIVDSKGGRQVITTPPTSSTPIGNWLKETLSPDGQWLAFTLGTKDKAPYDLSLNLLNIFTGEIKKITPLLSADYPNNFQNMANAVNKQFLPKYPVSASELQSSFGWVIGLSAWSPDGKVLAFVGEMEGPSSDLYIHDVANKTITRLDNDPRQMRWITWSPDGKWLVYGISNSSGGSRDAETFVAIDYKDGTRKVFDRYRVRSKWISDSWLAVEDYDLQERSVWANCKNLAYLDLEKGEEVAVWAEKFYCDSFAYDPHNEVFLFISRKNDNSIYLVNRAKPLEELRVFQGLPIMFPLYWDSSNYRFLIITDGSVRGISLRGELSPILGTSGSISPNKQVLAVSMNGLLVLGAKGELLYKVNNVPTGLSFWHPDSQSFFIRFSGDLYYVDWRTSNSQLVYKDVPSDIYDNVVIVGK